MAINNYSYVVKSNFNPMSFQEIMTPLLLYKDVYDESEAAYNELNQKADTFKYLAKRLEDNPDSEAAQIYKGYADELYKQASDLAKHGLSANNRRSLADLKRRYSGEIGILEKANKAMEEEKKLRRENKDNSMLYAIDNLDIDQFLYDRNPNLYSVSGNELYQKGAIIGKNFSSRIFKAGDAGRTLNGYFRDFLTTRGITPDKLARFQNEILEDFTSEVSVLPELQQAAQSLLDANGVTGNLKGTALRQAQHQVIRGIVDNAIYEEKHDPVRDPGVMSAAESASNARADINTQATLLKNGLRVNPNTGKVERIPGVNAADGADKPSTTKTSQLNSRVRITWENNPETSKYNVKELGDTETEYAGEGITYNELPDNIRRGINKVLQGSNPNLYHYYYVPWESGIFNDTEASVDIVPYKIVTTNNDYEDASDSFGE